MFTGKCYHCGQVGHTMGKCPERIFSQTMEMRTTLIQKDEASSASSPMGKDGPI